MSEAAVDSLHEEEALGKAYDTRLIRRLWQFVRPYRRQVAATLVLVVPVFLVELAPAWIIKQGLDSALGEGDSTGFLSRMFAAPDWVHPFLWLAGIYLVISVLSSLLNYLNLVIMATTGQSAMRDLRRSVFDHIQNLHLGFFDRYPVGRLVTRATNDVENVAEMFSAGIVALITDVVKMVGFAVALTLVNAELAFWTFLVVPFLVVAAIFFRLKVREAFRMVRVRIARINTHTQETVVGMKIVQLFRRESRNFAEFDEMNASHRDAWKMSIRYDALLFSSVEAAQNITITVIVWYGSGLAEAGVIYVFIDWMRRFFMPLRDLSAKYSVMQSSMASSERIFNLFDTTPDLRDAEVPAELPAQLDRGGVVEFENVWFKYNGVDGGDDDPSWVLRNVSFRVESGEKVALVGATGEGKTTIIKLLIRLYDVTRGRILVDGVDVRELRQQDLRRRVATVLQDVALFTGTVGENISLGRSDIDEADIQLAARAVRADHFVSALPQGYQTEVRERGTNFSAGQRQLLSFARALAHGAEILVLDEATSSIDSETEALVQQGIHALMEHQTSIAIAHRLSTIRDVDQIHVVEGGRLVESGGHAELLALDGAYARLYHLQYEAQQAGLGSNVASAGVSGD